MNFANPEILQAYDAFCKHCKRFYILHPPRLQVCRLINGQEIMQTKPKGAVTLMNKIITNIKIDYGNIGINGEAFKRAWSYSVPLHVAVSYSDEYDLYKVVKRVSRQAENRCEECGTKLVSDSLSPIYGDHCPNENCEIIQNEVLYLYF